MCRRQPTVACGDRSWRPVDSRPGAATGLKNEEACAEGAGAVIAQKFWGGGALLLSAPSSPSPFSPFSETEKIRTSYRLSFEIYH